MVRVNNVVAIFMAGNAITMSHTKSVDISYKCVDYSIVEIAFVKSAENGSDFLTNNLGGELVEKVSKKLIGENPE